MTTMRDHGGTVDAAAARWGGSRSEWLDLSTGINPIPYPLEDIPDHAWSDLPDSAAVTGLIHCAGEFWRVPSGAEVLPLPGASAAISLLPRLLDKGSYEIPGPTYNEHEAAFKAAGHRPGEGDDAAFVVVHPNNPDGRVWSLSEIPKNRPLCVIDESFADIAPQRSLVALADRPRTVVLKSFGKFWGLAGVRLGFAIGRPETIAPLKELLGPWPVSGPAISIGTKALSDRDWAQRTRKRLARDADRLDAEVMRTGAQVVGGTSLFRLYAVGDAAKAVEDLARAKILGRRFPYSRSWLRLGLPGSDKDWDRLRAALEDVSWTPHQSC